MRLQRNNSTPATSLTRQNEKLLDFLMHEGTFVDSYQAGSWFLTGEAREPGWCLTQG